MIPRILSSGETAPAGALVLDGAAPGGAATYSHWQQAPACPTELDADTSTGMALRAAADPGRWLGGFTWAVNDHVDADGLLSLAVACRPEVGRAHAAEILGAAEAGDFATWPGEAPFRLMLLIHQLMRNAKGDKQRCVDDLVARFPEVIAEAPQSDTQRDASVAQVLAVRTRLANRQGFAIEQLGDLVTIVWERVIGHAWDQFGEVDRRDDLPVWALGGMFPDTAFQLLAERQADGTTYVLDAPRHSWARTVVRPMVRWPDLTRAQRRLNGLDSGRCRWVIRPEALRVGFVAQLASVDERGLPACSGQPLPTVASAIREALRLR